MRETLTPKERIRRLRSVERVDADSNGISLTFGTSLTFVGAETYEDIVAILWRDMQWALRVCAAAVEATRIGTLDRAASLLEANAESQPKNVYAPGWEYDAAIFRKLVAAIEDTEGGAQ